MPANARKPRNNPVKHTLALSLPMCALVIAASCSSPSSSEFGSDAGETVDVAGCNLPGCENPESLPSGACSASKTPGCLANIGGGVGCEGTTYRCVCNETWSCTVTCGGLSGCYSSPDSGADASTDAADLDASDASDGDAS